MVETLNIKNITYTSDFGRDDHYPLYDRLVLDSTLPVSPEVKLFADQIGSIRRGVTLTYADTNNQWGNKIPEKQGFIHHALSVNLLPKTPGGDLIDPATQADFMDLIRKTYIRFHIEPSLDVFYLPLWKFFGPNQLVVADAVTTVLRYGTGEFTGIWPIKKPIGLEPGLVSWLGVFLPGGTSAAALNGMSIGFNFETQRGAITA